MHPTGTVRRTTLYNMVLILLSIIVAAIAVAISMVHSSFGGLAGSVTTKESIVRQGAEQAAIGGPTKQFLVVVLPDGKIVSSIVSERF
jgi:hypothetical protein